MQSHWDVFDDRQCLGAGAPLFEIGGREVIADKGCELLMKVMVQSQADRIQQRGIRGRVVSRRKAVAFVRTGGQREGVQEWLECGGSGLACSQAGDIADAGRWLAQAKTFVGQKEESPALQDWAA